MLFHCGFNSYSSSYDNLELSVHHWNRRMWQLIWSIGVKFKEEFAFGYREFSDH